MATSGHPHELVEPCPAGRDLYATAVRDGGISRAAVAAAPCLVDLALLEPDHDDGDWLLPVPAQHAMAGLLQSLEQNIRDRQRQAVKLALAFSRFTDISAEPPLGAPATVLEGLGTINAALDRAVTDCAEELLTVQPEAARGSRALGEALRRVRPLIDRGVSMRTLYQHAAREAPLTRAYLRFVGPHRVKVRTLEEIIERLIIVDRKVAYIPARPDRQVALEVRHPGLVGYLAGAFDQFWQIATPIEQAAYAEPTPEGVSGIQRSIARLLVEGHLDEAIARRLGISVRTCRAHTARLATLLGSSSRTQLGYLIARSGILEEA
ncbi:LuxR C-terminal-related transcriptional regulator [Streptomyces sp. 184]|uniref:helix-turn-helix transcriptional regulator n=1 Tax=Streptomyces sp. 184 TaxID=1827526 RepID=UPI003891E225